MTHRRIEEVLPWLVNGTLEGAERRRVEEHLATCSECASTLEELREISAQVEEILREAPEPRPGLFQEAQSRIETWEREHSRRSTASSLRDLAQRLALSFSGWWQPLPVYARAVIAA